MEDDNLIDDERGYRNGLCCGTQETSFCWCNAGDTTGLICCILVAVFILYSAIVVGFGYQQGYFDKTNSIAILVLCGMSFWCHFRTMFGDPGAVPRNAHPIPSDIGSSISVCGRCDAYKPPGSHHDRVSNRCISRMDHFCPWMNNAIGAKNQKNFILFLIYTNVTASYIYIYLALHLVML